jgi:hypothetical protein
MDLDAGARHRRRLAGHPAATGALSAPQRRLHVPHALRGARLLRLSKETALAALLVLPAADGIIYRWQRGRWLRRGYAALLLLTLTYLGVRSRFVDVESTFLIVPSQFFLKQLVSLPFKTLAQPWNVEAMALPPWILFLTAMAPLTLLVLAVWRRRGDWRLLFGPALIVGSVLPVYSYFFVDANLMSSRYIYFAAAGWAIVIADLLTRVLSTRLGTVAALLVVVTLDAVGLTLNLRPWRTVGAMVTDMQSRLAAGQPPASVVEDWRARLGEDLKVRDGIPRAYRGVYVFENGWREFQEPQNSEF